MPEALRYGWEKDDEAFSTLRRTAPSLWVLLCQILGAVFCFAFLASFVLACAPWVSLASAKCSLLLPTSHGRDHPPCRRASGLASPSHLVLFLAVFLAFSHLIFSPVGEFHKTRGIAVAWLPAALCV